MLALGLCDGAHIVALRGRNQIYVTIPAEKTEPADDVPTTVIPPICPLPPVVVANAAEEYAFFLRLTKIQRSICSPHEVLPPRSIASVRRSRSSCDSEAGSGFVNKLYFVFDMNRCMQKPTETSKESKEPEPRDHMTVSQMEEAKNAEKFLPPRGSVRFSFCTTGGYSGYSQLPMCHSWTPSHPTPTTSRTSRSRPPPPRQRPRSPLCSPGPGLPAPHVDVEYRAVPLGYCSGTRGYRCRRRRTMGMELSAVSEVVLTVVLWYPWVVG